MMKMHRGLHKRRKEEEEKEKEDEEEEEEGGSRGLVDPLSDVGGAVMEVLDGLLELREWHHRLHHAVPLHGSSSSSSSLP